MFTFIKHHNTFLLQALFILRQPFEKRLEIVFFRKLKKISLLRI